MGKSAKKSASKDAAVAAPAPAPAKPLKKGKRKAEVVVIEKELASAKKQKVVAGNKSDKKVESDTESAQKPENKPAPLAKKEGDSEDVVPAAKMDEEEKPVPKKKKQSTGGGGSKTLFVGNLSFDVKEADIEEFFKPAGQVVEIRLGRDPKDDKFRGFCHVDFATVKQAKKAFQELNGQVLLERVVRIGQAKRKGAQREQVKDDSTSDGGSKTLFVGNLSFDAKEADIVKFFEPAGEVVEIRLARDPKDDKFRGFCHVDFATVKQAEKALEELNGQVLLQREVRIGLVDRKPAQREQVKDDSTGGGGGSKTLFVGNLSFDANEADIEEFFEPAGEVVEIRLGRDPKDDKFRGFCHVDFATAKQAEKALLELNGKVMLQRAVRLGLPTEKPAQREQVKDELAGGGGSKTLFVSNLSFDAKEADILEFFERGGEVVEIRLAKDPKDNKFRGYCQVDFASAEQAEKAFEELNGKVLLQRVVKIGLADRKPAQREQVKDDSTGGDGGSKTLFVGNLSFDAKEADIVEFFEPAGEVVAIRLATDPKNDNKFRGFCHVDFATAKQAEKALEELNGKVLLQREVNISLVDRRPAKREHVKDDSTGGVAARTLFVGNVSFNVNEVDIEAFFEQVGDVCAIRFAMDPEDNKFKGFCHVEMGTAKQAEKALLELNGKLMLNRAVNLGLARERRAGGDNSQRGPRPEAVFVKGFDTAEGENKIRSSLMAHFSSCGPIDRICIPSYEDGSSKGFAYIYFQDDDSRIKSLDLNESVFGNGFLKVDVTNSKDEKNSARGRSDFGGGRGGGRGGRGRGRGGRGRGRGRGGRR